jgi:hypothetical protein
MERNIKLKIYAEFKRALIRTKPLYAKLEKLMNELPLAKKIIKSTNPLRCKLSAKLKTNLDKVNKATAYVDKEIQNLREQYKEVPKQAITDVLVRARSYAKTKYRKPLSPKPNSSNVKKKDTRHQSA